MYRILLTVILAFVLPGCAHFTTYQADVGSPSTGVSFDAKQRLLLVNDIDKPETDPRTGAPLVDQKTGVPVVMKKQRRMCVEPSPDALSALGASLGASILGSGGSTKQIAAALGESTGSIGLRTTSIQLLRDAMYRVCEAYLNEGITGGEYADLQAHAQTLVVGLLAIEQLTGAVQAQQVALIANSAAGGVPDVTAEADNLLQSQKATLGQQAKVDAATSAKSVADKAVVDKDAAVNKAKANPNTKPEDLKKLEEELSSLKDEASKATAALKNETDALEVYKQSEAIAKTTFDMAMSRVRSSVSGSANFGQNTFSRGNMSDHTAIKLADAVNSIVSTVVGVSIDSQKCLNSMLKTNFAVMERDQKEAIFRMCKVFFDAEELRIKNMQQRQIR